MADKQNSAVILAISLLRAARQKRKAGLKIAQPIFQCVQSIAEGTGIKPEQFWKGFASMIRDFAPENARLLEKRDKLQAKIDAYYNQTRRNKSEISPEQDDRFLRNIGYIVGNGRTISSATETPHSVNIVNTQNLDPEITSIPGPQLVVPVDNARYALNAANARWGSLLDAIYGTDAIDGGDSKKLSRGKESGYDPKRGKEIFDITLYEQKVSAEEHRALPPH
mmetsp:Transcript_10134/g.16331  ORF Transcript_10134/g.16331 Transcript_10134/m.16331 type:complete len:223 (+) Transcript_10134:205-873(+)